MAILSKLRQTIYFSIGCSVFQSNLIDVNNLIFGEIFIWDWELITKRLSYMFECLMFLKTDFLLVQQYRLIIPLVNFITWRFWCFCSHGSECWRGRLSHVLSLSSPRHDWGPAGHRPALHRASSVTLLAELQPELYQTVAMKCPFITILLFLQFSEENIILFQTFSVIWLE